MSAVPDRSRPFDVAIAGGSFAGLALALALVRSLGPELEVALVERASAEAAAASDDPRALAISQASRAMLEALGVWSDIAAVAEPVARIEITDSALSAGVRPVLLSWDNRLAGDAGSAAACIAPAPALTAALVRAVEREPSIKVLRGQQVAASAPEGWRTRLFLDDGSQIPALLAVAADGAGSTLREAAGIKVVRWSYAQSGIVCTVAHERPHHGIAVQHFLPSGPFAILPLPGSRSCITWTEGEDQARRIMALGDAGFLAEVDRRFGGRLGRLELVGRRGSWPLQMHLARSYVAPRLALVGDAAHVVHPLAGQGLNLALRDVAALAECVADATRIGLDAGDDTVLSRYQRWRRFDSVSAAAAFDILNRLFAGDLAIVRSLRELGLQAVDRLPGLKPMLIAEAAGTTGELPRLMRGELP